MTSKKVALGSMVMVAKRFAVRFLGLGSTFILARLLAPDDFGLLALALSFSVILEALAEFKLDHILVRTENIDESHYSTAWTLNIIGNTTVALVLVLAAPLFASFSRAPSVTPVLQAVALCIVIDGFCNTGMIEWRRKIQFGQEFQLEFYRKITEALVAVGWAFWWPSVWALVAGMVVSRLMGLVLSYVLHPMRPRWTLKHWRQLAVFSGLTVGYTLASRFAIKADTFIISRLQSLNAVGLYSNASSVASLPTMELVKPIGVALFSGFSAILNDLPRLREAYFKGLHGVLLVTLPMAVGLSFVADAAVRIMLGPKWMSCVPLLQGLALAQIVTLSGASSWSLLVALNKMQGLFYRSLLMLIARPTIVYLTISHYGFYAVPFAILAASFLQVGTDNWCVRRALRFSLATWLARTWRPYAATLLMAAALWFLLPSATTLTVLDAFIKLGIAVAIGAPVYVLCALTFWHLAGRPDGLENMAIKWIGARIPGLRR